MNTSYPPKSVVGALRHQPLVVGGVVLACLALGLAFVLLLPRTYQAQATLLVDTRWAGSQDPNASLLASEELARQFVEEATSRSLLEQVISRTGLNTSPERLARRVSARAVHGTPLIGVRATGGKPAAASAVANAVAQALIDRNQAAVRTRFEATRSYLNEELARLQGEIQNVSAEKVPANNPSATADHSARLALLQNQYNSTYNLRQEAALAETRGASTLSLVDQATPPGAPVSPDPLRDLLAALVIGLCLGTGAALVVERFDDRVRTPENLAIAAGTPLVVSVPEKGARSSLTRAYSLAHANLVAHRPNTKVVMLASASPRDRSQGPAEELAAAAELVGQRVVVLGSDAGTEGLPQAPGHNGSQLATQPLPAGAEPISPRTIEAQGQEYDFAVRAVPSPQLSPEAVAFAPAAGAAILVASGRTKFLDAQRAAELLRQSGVELVGSIFVVDRIQRNGERPYQRP